jgi:carboxyl-terminal processing protease
MKFRFFIFILLIFLLIAGCEKLFFEPDPENTPENNFEIFWKDFDNYYAQFQIRNINWDSVYTVTRTHITAATTDRELFGILSNLVLLLNDMHTTLYTPYGDVFWSSQARGIYPSSKLINPCKYIACGATQNAIIESRMCKNNNIGYLNIYTFTGDGSMSLFDDRYLLIDDILKQFKDTKGLLIDVRWNGGGNSGNSELVASRFADQKRVYTRFKMKDGPGKNDFSEWKTRSISPNGSFQYTKPVVVLTSRATCSAAEDFVMAMQVLPQVTIVGDTTGGGIGNPIFRELPNGWTFRLSTKVGATADGHIVEGNGIPPDVPVTTTVADSLRGADRIIEKGIEILESAH